MSKDKINGSENIYVRRAHQLLFETMSKASFSLRMAEGHVSCLNTWLQVGGNCSGLARSHDWRVL